MLRHPLTGLAVVLALALGLRAHRLLDPFQLDEFGPLYAIAYRDGTPPGFIPATSDPLIPVPAWEIVRSRSVLPYGVVHPLPVYHTLLYGLIHVLPITTWTLRLPSLLAGLGCVAGVYFLCRRGLGPIAALIAALFAAIDPMQITMSVLARPYALGNLAYVLSCMALLGLLHARDRRRIILNALGYGVAVAAMGYMNTLYLLGGVAHVALVLTWYFHHDATRAWKLGAWLAGGTLGVVLLLPLRSYVQAVDQFSRAHQEYLFRLLLGPTPFSIVVHHNSTFFLCMLVLSIAAGIAYLLGASTQSLTAERESADLAVLSRYWFFLPQLVAIGLIYVAHQAVFLSRYLGYSTLGGAIILAATIARFSSLRVRLALAAPVVLVIALWSRQPGSQGFNVNTWADAAPLLDQLDLLAERGIWHNGDALLYRPAFLEADFLPDELPAASRAEVQGVLEAPLTTLYANRRRKPIISLSLSMRRGNGVRTSVAEFYQPEKLYNAALAERIRPYRRFWVCSYAWDRVPFLVAFLPWLADAVEWDLLVARNRPRPDGYVEVLTDSGPDDFLPGLTESQAGDFFIHLLPVRRLRPPGIFTLGCLLAAPMPDAHIMVPVWLSTQWRTPRLTTRPPTEKTEPLRH